MREEDKIVVKRHFEKINSLMECKLYMESEDIPEDKEIFVYGFKHV